PPDALAEPGGHLLGHHPAAGGGGPDGVHPHEVLRPDPEGARGGGAHGRREPAAHPVEHHRAPVASHPRRGVDLRVHRCLEQLPVAVHRHQRRGPHDPPGRSADGDQRLRHPVRAEHGPGRACRAAADRGVPVLPAADHQGHLHHRHRRHLRGGDGRRRGRGAQGVARLWASPPSRGSPSSIPCSAITWRGMNSATVIPTTSNCAPRSAITLRTCALVSPPGTSPRPKVISSLSTVSTSRWIATLRAPVEATHCVSAADVRRSCSGPKALCPHRGRFARASGSPAFRPAWAKREGGTVAGRRSMISGSPCPIRVAAAIAWKPSYPVAGVSASGWASIQTTARSSPYFSARAANGATLTAHSPPSVRIRSGACRAMASCAAVSEARIAARDSIPALVPSAGSSRLTGTVSVGPLCRGRTASSTREPVT